MKAIPKISARLHSRGCAYLFFVFALFSFVGFQSADWAYGWITTGYPLGEKFIPTFLAVAGITAGVHLLYLFFSAFFGTERDKRKGAKAFRIVHTVFAVLAVLLFIYTIILLFGLDSGLTTEKLNQALTAIGGKLVYLALGAGFALVLVFCNPGKRAVQSLVSGVVICALLCTMGYLSGTRFSTSKADDFIQPQIKEDNVLSGGEVTYESLASNEKTDAANLLTDNGKCWTPQAPNRGPKDGYPDANNAVAEIQLKEKTTFNTAIIKELGNEVQYFRLQAKVDDNWVTVYQSEKIQSLRLCSFDPVTTDAVRLSIDQFRSDTTPAKIQSLQLFDLQKRAAGDFEVTAYQRLDGDVPTEILAKGDAYVRNYAKFYDVYSTVIVFAALHWTETGDLGFGDGGEEKFATELNALKQIIARRSNQSHKVKLIVTTLSDGAFGGDVNGYMTKYWEKVEAQTVDFAAKYAVDGVDIDWEYPQSTADWQVYDRFIQKLAADLKAQKSDSIISAALSASQLGMTKETLDCIDQIQFMAYDGCDKDGYQSSLEQAQEGLAEFKKNGADIAKINIGIAAYGRPVNSTPYWATWRDLPDATYWNSKYHTVEDADQVYVGTFCAPALAGDKAAYALLTGAGGVMVFRVGCDKLMDDPNSVACGLQNTMDRLVEQW